MYRVSIQKQPRFKDGGRMNGKFKHTRGDLLLHHLPPCAPQRLNNKQTTANNTVQAQQPITNTAAKKRQPRGGGDVPD